VSIGRTEGAVHGAEEEKFEGFSQLQLGLVSVFLASIGSETAGARCGFIRRLPVIGPGNSIPFEMLVFGKI
jgi:hypothetical protein